MSLRDLPLSRRVDVDAVVENSFKDFHQKGFDYLCLSRTLQRTEKLYFFDGDVTKLSEVVAPHDHRYDFDTWVACGASENVWFKRSLEPDEGQVYNWFEYRTPLNGGDGFTFVGEEQLVETKRRQFAAGERYTMEAPDFHTIRIAANETVLLLVQYADRVALDRPTSTFTTGEAPSLDGLYSKFKADEVIGKLQRFEERTGHFFGMMDLKHAA